MDKKDFKSLKVLYDELKSKLSMVTLVAFVSILLIVFISDEPSVFLLMVYTFMAFSGLCLTKRVQHGIFGFGYDNGLIVNKETRDKIAFSYKFFFGSIVFLFIIAVLTQNNQLDKDYLGLSILSIIIIPTILLYGLIIMIFFLITVDIIVNVSYPKKIEKIYRKIPRNNDSKAVFGFKSLENKVLKYKKLYKKEYQFKSLYNIKVKETKKLKKMKAKIYKEYKKRNKFFELTLR